MEEIQFTAGVFLEGFHAFLLGSIGHVEVVFISDQNAGFVLLKNGARDLALLGGDAARGIEDEGDHVGAADAALGAFDAEGFDNGVHLGLAADAGGIDEQKMVIAPAVKAVDRIARGAGDFGNHGAVLAENGVEEGAFSHVGTADDGHTDGFGEGFGLAFGWGGGHEVGFEQFQ